jgi:hypothetical protein
MTEENPEKQQITGNEDPKGSLGLLALGYQGIVHWRKIKVQSGISEAEKTRLIRPAEKKEETEGNNGE